MNGNPASAIPIAGKGARLYLLLLRILQRGIVVLPPLRIMPSGK